MDRNNDIIGVWLTGPDGPNKFSLRELLANNGLGWTVATSRMVEAKPKAAKANLARAQCLQSS